MQISFKPMALAAVVAAGACVGALAFASAGSAATGYTLTPGGSVKAVNSGTLTFVDTTSTSKPKLTCSTFTASGTAKKGAHKYVPATYPNKTTGLNPAVSLPKRTLTGCTNTTVGAVTVTPSATWYLGLSKKSSTGGTGYLYNVTATVSAAGCKFTSTGAVYGTYANKTGTFSGTTKPGLVLSKVTGGTCGLVGVANGDKAYLSGKVVVSPKQSIK